MEPTPPLHGIIPILVTPFDRNEEVDVGDLQRQLDLLMAAGVGAVGLGFGSEVQRLAPEEITDLIRHVVAHGGDRLSVVGNADVTSTRAGVAAVRRLADAGASFAMLRPAGLQGLAQRDLMRTLATVSVEGGLPTVIQDAPQNTGVELSADTLGQLLLDVGPVAALKIEPPGAATKISAVVAALGDHPHGPLIGGLGGIDLVHELDRGIAATMPGPAFPEVFMAIQALYGRGDRAAARSMHARILPLITLGARHMDAFLFQQKRILVERGALSSPRLRRPHAPIDPLLDREIGALLTSIGFEDLLADAQRVMARPANSGLG